MAEERTKKITTLDGLMFVNNFVALGAGAYHGFCNARGIPIDKESFEASTLYGPSLLMAGFASMKSVFGEYERNPGPVGGALAGGVHGAIVTAVGYGLGYAAGKIGK